MNQSDTESIIKEVKSRIRQEESKITRFHFIKNTLKYAAIFCLIFGLGYYSNNNYVSNNEVEKIIPKKNDIVLTSTDNGEVVIEKDDNKTDEKKLFLKLILFKSQINLYMIIT